MNTLADKVQAAAYRELTLAGMIQDPDLLGLVDTSAVKIVGDDVIVPAGFAEQVKRSKPHLFQRERPLPDARELTAEQFDAAVRRIDSDIRADYVQREHDRYLEQLGHKYAGRKEG